MRGFVALSTVDQNDGIGAAVPPSMLMTSEQALQRNVDLVRAWGGDGPVRATLALRQIIVCSPGLHPAMAAGARHREEDPHPLCEGTYEIDYARRKIRQAADQWLDRLGVLGHPPALRPLGAAGAGGDRICTCGTGSRSATARSATTPSECRASSRWRAADRRRARHRRRRRLRHARHVPGRACCARRAAGGGRHAVPHPHADKLRGYAALATRRGAGARHRRGVGSLEVGKKADIVWWTRRNGPVAAPRSAVRRRSRSVGRDVRSVIIDGRLVMKEREILTVDMDALRARLAPQAPQIMARFEALVA